MTAETGKLLMERQSHVPDPSQYDIPNISECLAIAPARDPANPKLITNYEIVGISSCLTEAIAKVEKRKEAIFKADVMKNVRL